MNIQHNPEFDRALHILNQTSDHLILTGRAGTGKSTLLNYFREHTEKKVVVLAPTGIAAINVHGETIHAFCGFKPSVTKERALKRAEHLKKHERALYKAVQMIVIDEVSMVRADLLDILDIFLRKAVGYDMPFGGKQMVFIGDLYQLPPVLKEEDRPAYELQYKTPYFFSADVIKELLWSFFPPAYVELMTIYRQDEQTFIHLLNTLRDGSCTQQDLDCLNIRVQSFPQDEENYIIHLTATNAQADHENEKKLCKLKDESVRYKAKTSGSVDERIFPAKDELEIKTGARIMMTTNDSEGRWQNGTLGKVKSCSIQNIEVELDNGYSTEIKPFTWEIFHTVLNEETNELEQKVMGAFTQYPIKLAWAITIHKSQGQTFDKVCIDLGRGAFAEGQTYVALSRCRTLSGVYLKRPLQQRDIIVDDRIHVFFKVVKQRQRIE